MPQSLAFCDDAEGAIDKRCIMTLSLQEVKNLDLPDGPGCYQFYDDKGAILYVGKAVSLRSRVLSYWQKSALHTPAKRSMLNVVAKITWTVTDTEIEALLLEANLIKKYRPPYNVVMRDDKRYAYIKISTDDEIPGVFITRKIDKSGRFFGPFTSTESVRQALKVIRRIWPYCTERRLKKKPCFYHQIDRCLGVCSGAVSLKEYDEKVIRPITLFLEGRKDKIVRNMKKELKRLEKKGDAESAKIAAFRVRNMQEVISHAKVIGIAEKYQSDVIELAKMLGLPKVPERIEGYDISNIFGKEAVGSMVVFTDGEPDRNEYRKFKIRADKPPMNDVEMLRQIIERRFTGHNGEGVANKTNWKNPDLIVIDGGKGQLNAAVSMIRRLRYDFPVVAISKGEGLRSARAKDKLFFPGEKKPLELPLTSPALHLIKRVRDESHRFAVNYHRLLRKKRMY